jgi:hypothetical protein
MIIANLDRTGTNTRTATAPRQDPGIVAPLAAIIPNRTITPQKPQPGKIGAQGPKTHRQQKNTIQPLKKKTL